MNNSFIKAFGGYFELEIPVVVDGLYLNAFKFKSARAAFHALLNTVRPNRVWMPKYVVDPSFMTMV